LNIVGVAEDALYLLAIKRDEALFGGRDRR